MNEEHGQVAEATQPEPASDVEAPAAGEDPSADGSRTDEYLRLAQRAQADLQNFRRRVEQERDEVRQAARVDAVMSLLPVLDDFERAIQAIPDDARQASWVQGILLIERNLRAQVERAGLERIEAQGAPFSPYEHEAIMTDASGQHQDDTVTAVIRPGYRIGTRVVRPAQVAVARRSE